MKVYEVSLADEYRKILEVYPELENKVKKLINGEKDWHFDCAVPVVNSITNYVDDVWVSKKMFNVQFFDEEFYVAVGHPLQKIINDVYLDTENWMCFQKSCKEQWDDDTDFVLVTFSFDDSSTQISIPKKKIFRLA